MSSGEHTITICRNCDAVIAQCRCNSPTKRKVYSLCHKCGGDHDPDRPSMPSKSGWEVIGPVPKALNDIAAIVHEHQTWCVFEIGALPSAYYLYVSVADVHALDSFAVLVGTVSGKLAGKIDSSLHLEFSEVMAMRRSFMHGFEVLWQLESAGGLPSDEVMAELAQQTQAVTALAKSIRKAIQ
jgi:hypothetical protein